MNDCKAKQPVFRRATLEDVPEVARRLRKLWGKIEPAYHGIKWDHPSAIITIDHVIRNGICLLGPTSCAGAMFAPFLWNHQQTVADIVFWSFVHPNEIRIFNEMAEVCKAAGATYVKANTHWPDNRIAKFYLKNGLHPSETSYLAVTDKCCTTAEKD